MTDQRLLCAASMVRAGGVLADIGTDHAHLPVWLIQNGICQKAIAADIGEGPAASARRTVQEAGLSACIEVRVGDGLSVLSPEEATEIVIAGMGGETIAQILAAAPWLKDGVDRRLVLQPMTKTVELREWLYQNGFSIEEEHLIRDGRHLYCVMAASFAAAPPPASVLAPYVGGLSDEEGAPYFAHQAAHLRRRAAGLRAGGQTEQAASLEALAAALEERI
ncbi:MAG: SAM-dependent methyltransferase [Ruminococcaceae bacterium]|nr:SAM-dependent methyltransferase [Oscillospiraceae bacterium]